MLSWTGNIKFTIYHMEECWNRGSQNSQLQIADPDLAGSF